MAACACQNAVEGCRRANDGARFARLHRHAAARRGGGRRGPRLPATAVRRTIAERQATKMGDGVRILRRSLRCRTPAPVMFGMRMGVRRMATRGITVGDAGPRTLPALRLDAARTLRHASGLHRLHDGRQHDGDGRQTFGNSSHPWLPCSAQNSAPSVASAPCKGSLEPKCSPSLWLRGVESLNYLISRDLPNHDASSGWRCVVGAGDASRKGGYLQSRRRAAAGMRSWVPEPALRRSSRCRAWRPRPGG
jgi:hypothetical protein